jgi:hypothetical protein
MANKHAYPSGHDTNMYDNPNGAKNCHQVRITGGPSRGRYGAKCTRNFCGWSVGEHYRSRDEAEDAADAHRLFTHPTGSFLCGSKACQACEAIERRRPDLGIPSHIGWALADPLRNLGRLPSDIDE